MTIKTVREMASWAALAAKPTAAGAPIAHTGPAVAVVDEASKAEAAKKAAAPPVLSPEDEALHSES